MPRRPTPVATLVTATVNDPNYQGAASGTFVINPLPSVLSVTVQSPNGGEQLLKGVPFTIRWTATGKAEPNPSSFDVALSRNGGSTFSNIAGCTNLNGALRSCTWTPSTTSSDARIRVTARAIRRQGGRHVGRVVRHPSSLAARSSTQRMQKDVWFF